MDPSDNSDSIIAIAATTAFLAVADWTLSYFCVRSGGRGPACWIPLRAGVRAGEAGGLFGLLAASGLAFPLSAVLAAGIYAALTLLFGDRLAARLAAPGAPGPRPGAPERAACEDQSAAGLSVVVSRAERLRDIPVSSLMVPRKSITGCDASTSVEEVAAIMRRTGFSRIIAFSKTLDRPLGLAHIKDMLPLMYGGRARERIEPLLRPLVLIPSNKRALDLLRDFQRLKRRVGIVRDLQGERTLGLVSTEDILEEMVGEIQDERELLSAALESGVALVRGDLEVGELIEGLGLSPSPERADLSLSEFVKSLLGRDPDKGDVVHFRGLRMEVEETVNGDVWMVRIERGET